MIDRRYPGPENIFRQVLGNGIVVLVFENRSNPTIAFEGLIRTGSLQDPRGKAGLAAFTAEMLMRGSEKYGYAQIFEKLENYGASLGFGAGRHATQFSGTCLSEDTSDIFELMAQVMRFPTFPPDQMERLRGQILTGLRIRASDTRRMAALRFMETLYQDHPYGISSQGYPETIASISQEDLITFHKDHYGPKGLILAVSGAIEPWFAVKKIDSILGDWANPIQQVVPDVMEMPRPKQKKLIEFEIPGKVQSDLLLGLPGPRRSAPDFLAISLANTILGTFGMMGRIGQSVREENGLAYYASSNLAGGLGPGPWTADAGTAPENIPQVIEGILEEIRRIQNEPVPALELEDCKSFRIGSLPVGLETNAALADTIVDLELYELGLNYLQLYPELINRISVSDVQKAAQKYLSSEQLVISVAGPNPQN